MGIFLLNISVDPADPNHHLIPEDLSFNDQESIVEIIVEQVLGYENAIKEYDDPDTEDQKKKKNIKLEWLFRKNVASEFTTDFSFIRKQKFYTIHGTRFDNRFKEIDSPPPKV